MKLSDGMVHVKWYHKMSLENIVVHARSAHPVTAKHAVIRNIFKTVVELCSGEAKRHSANVASAVAHKKVLFPEENFIAKFVVRAKAMIVAKKPPLPFISDKVSDAIKKCLVRAEQQDDVVIVNIPNKNINPQLVRNRLGQKM